MIFALYQQNGLFERLNFVCGLQKPGECIRSQGVGGTGVCEQPDLGARNSDPLEKQPFLLPQVSVVEGVLQCFSQEYGSLGLIPSILGKKLQGLSTQLMFFLVFPREPLPHFPRSQNL